MNIGIFLKPLDRLTDGITMYRLTLYYLIALLVAAVALSATGHLGYNPMAIILSSLYLVVVCGVVNAVFARVLEVPAGLESTHITALILALIITPGLSLDNAFFLAVAGGLAVASKYILAVHRKHIFNPAALAVVLTSLAGHPASWWVGNPVLLPLVLCGGLLLARKIRRLAMVVLFFDAAVLSAVVLGALGGNNIAADLQYLLLRSSLFFFGFVMLAEPLTTPPTAAGRSWYAALAGALFPPQIHLLGLYSTPELALVASNVFSYLISPKRRLMPRLMHKLQLTPDIMDFIFMPEGLFPYRAGQYVEVTLGHHSTDSRGNRRYFTLASSPTEPSIQFGVKFYPKGSSFKRAMQAMDPRTPFAVSAPAGDFTLPLDASQKLAFIAGGIGITPFRSMVKYMLDSQDSRPTVLLYAESKPEEFVYTDIFAQAGGRIGLKAVYWAREAPPGWQGRQGRITADAIAEEIPDYRERLFYISGSLSMVAAIHQALEELSIPPRQVKTDYFPGYAG